MIPYITWIPGSRDQMMMRSRGGGKVLIFKGTPGFGKWRKYFPDAAVTHPAKINLYLLEYLILNYTDEGNVILDPMSGTGSTGVICALNGRDCIQVELEKRFFEWMEQARENVEKASLLTKKGKIINIRGDARRLSKLLKEKCDTILFSPPYARTVSPFVRGAPLKQIQINIQEGYSRDPNNIGNLPFVDVILTSPPYEECMSSKHHSPKADLIAGEKKIGMSYTGKKKKRANIGNLKGETYLKAMRSVYSECYKVLQPSGLLILILKNFIRNRKIVPLTDYTIKIVEEIGFKPKERLLFKLPHHSYYRILYKKRYPDVDTTGINFEHILIFKK